MPDQIIKLELPLKDVNVLMAGLGKLPLEAVIDLWSRIKEQAEAQLKPQE